MSRKLTYIVCILLVEAAGFVTGIATRDATALYASSIAKPDLSPPAIVFPIAWTLLYGLMGVGLARVWLADGSGARTAGIALFAVQLALNLAWSFIFFGAQRFDLALVELIALFVAVAAMTICFWKADVWAGVLQIPYLMWLCFATYLCYGVMTLN